VITVDTPVEAYELSPLQQGMLVHSLRDRGVGLYVNQEVQRLHEVDVGALRAAWQRLLERHDVLRSSFHWEDLDSPRQVVHRDVSLTIEEHDWRELSAAGRESALLDFLEADRERGFELTRPPLLRVALLRLTTDSHYLVFSHHHLLLDGWSHPLIAAEVRALYEAKRRGREPSLRRTRPYSDYIAWLAEQDAGAAEAFWREHLGGIVAATPLPGETAGGRDVRGRLSFGDWRVRVDARELAALEGAARICRVTLNTFIQGAWALLLSRYSGERDVVFGVLVSGRPPDLEGVERMIGMFVNTLPLRVTVEPRRPLRDWLAEIQQQQVEARRYEYSPLMLVQRWASIPSGTPLFESMVVNENVAPSRAPSRGARQRVVPPSTRQNVPLLLSLHNFEDELVMTLTYDARRFVDGSIPRVMEQLRTLLVGMAAAPSSRLDALELSSDAEVAQMLVGFNRTDTDCPTDRALHELFEDRAARDPDAPAVMFEGEAVSYATLDKTANQLAAHLRAAGARPGSLVGLCVPRSPAMAAGLLAILKAGAACVPLDPAYPVDRRRFMLDDAGAPVLVTQEGLVDSFGAQERTVVCVDRDRPVWSREPSESLGVAVDPEAVAYVLYTSGSTGTPKGVALPHRVAVNRIHVEHDPFEAGEALCVKTSLSFVDSLWELFGSWHNGLCAHLVPDDHARDPRLLVDDLAQAQATRIDLVPSLLRAMLDPEVDVAARLPGVRHWISTGEPLPPDLCARFAERLPGAILTNLYGISEVWDATRCDSRERPPGEPLPIGRPIGNVRVYVLDAALRPAPLGAPGELYIAGAGLAHGYWRRPALTAEKFVPDPFAEAGGDRLYRTGDLARWLPDGNLEYLGRIDNQLKIRGYRVEPGEIESVLRSHDAVRQAAVITSSRDQLVAYVVAEAGRDAPHVAELQAFVRARLPDPLVPNRYVAIERLPLTPSGKVDRRAVAGLTDAVETPVRDGRDSRPPSTPTERAVAEVWAAVLEISPIGADSDFFDLGGHSLLAMRVASRLSRSLEMSIPLNSVFEGRTVAGMAAWIERARTTGGEDEALADHALERAARGKTVPVSLAQQRLWVLDQLDPGSPSYTVPSDVRFDGPLDLGALTRAVTEIVRRHEALRTTFSALEGGAYQVVNGPPDVPIPVVDMTGVPPAEHDRAVRRALAEQAGERWDLVNGPLVRLRLLRLAPEAHVLAVTMHHIVTDGRSMGIFAHELVALYGAFRDGRRSPLPPLPVQYADYAVWQREALSSEGFERQKRYWLRTLDGVAPLQLPHDRPPSAGGRYRGARRGFSLPVSLSDAFAKLAREERATSFMVLLAGFTLLLARYCGQEDVTVGTPAANRNRVELERLIGFFVNTLVIRTDLRGDPSFRDLLARVRERCIEAFAHGELPFDLLVNTINPPREPGRHPLFDVMLVHQRSVPRARDRNGVSARAEAPELDTANFDLLLVVNESDEGVECTLRYDRDLFDAATAERICRHFRELLERACADPDRRVSEIPLVSREERDRLTSEWSRGAEEPRDERCIHDLVAEVASTRPGQTAVVFGDRTLTYRELVQWSNSLALRLQALGAGPEAIVGVRAGRSIELVVGLLGALTAGGAFLVLDPAHPPERLAFMVRDAAPVEVLTPEDVAAAWGESVAPPKRSVRPENLAYVAYTSGSTGTPKGVLVTHEGLANTIRAQIREFGLGPGSRVLQTLAPSFDAALGEIFRTLAAGGTLHLARGEELLPGPALVERLREDAITCMAIVPAALALMPSPDGLLPELETLIVGGEPCAPDLARRWGHGRRMVNGYGPTETAIGATRAIDWDLDRKPPLGRPLTNVAVHVLDRRLHPVPVGVAGELFIGGPGVARGYLGAAGVTAERFMPNPFAVSPGERLYRTGDHVRWLADGTLDYLGRVDEQVKIRGFRVELGEVESALRCHEAVADCAIDVRGTGGERQLVAYYTAADGHQTERAELRGFLRSRLPDHAVPARFVPVAAVPRTSSGKLDRGALPDPGAFDDSAEAAHVAPRNHREATLARIWAEVLGVDRVGVTSNFFELGGDSLTTVRVAARAGAAGVRVSAQDMMQRQTIADLAEAVVPGHMAVAEQGPVTGDVPLTPVQRWFLDANPADPNHFNQWLSTPAPPGLDWGAWVEALGHVVDHHDALRLRFKQTPGGWVQTSAPPGSGAAAGRVDDIDELQTSLDLADGPLLKAGLVGGGGGRPQLALVAHHLVVDTLSWPVLMEDVWTAYRQTREGVPVDLPPKTASFKSWAEALHEYADSEPARRLLPAWVGLAAAETPARLPRDHDGSNSRASAAVVDASLGAEDTAALVGGIPHAHGWRVHQLVLAALALALAGWTQNRRVRVTIERHGRADIERLDVSRTVGWFTDFHPIDLDVAPARRPLEAVGTVVDQLRAVPDPPISYSALRYMCTDRGTRERLEQVGEPEIAFNFAGSAGRADARPAPIRLSESSRGERRHTFEVLGGLRGGRIELRLAYSTGLHERHTVQQLADSVVQVLASIARDVG
jgi:amino acid adenylation domain-containing protein/non-ribosomal peptide synthase protein (TIGR01720 family)